MFQRRTSYSPLVVSLISSFDSIGVNSLTGVIGLNQLYELSMSKLGFDIDIERISDFSTNIKTLDLSKNSFSFKDKFKVCDDLPNLESLDLSGSNLTGIPSTFFVGCEKPHILEHFWNKL